MFGTHTGLDEDAVAETEVEGNGKGYAESEHLPPVLNTLAQQLEESEAAAVYTFRSLQQTRDIPVIFVTALSEEGDERKGLELGAIDFIVKPYSPEILHARVATHLALKECRERLQSIDIFSPGAKRKAP
ncbi:MAG: response regulator [Sedimenticola sp.]